MSGGLHGDGVEQLRAEIGRRVDGAAALLSSDDHLAHSVMWERWLQSSAAETLVAQLAADVDGTEHDQQAAAQACIDVLNALWGDGDPPDQWWRTALGRLCASSSGVDGAEMVSAHVAAAMLGVHPGDIAAMCATGQLDRHPDGGIVASSVQQHRSRRRGT